MRLLIQPVAGSTRQTPACVINQSTAGPGGTASYDNPAIQAAVSFLSSRGSVEINIAGSGAGSRAGF